MGSRDGGVSTETGFQDCIMDKHVLLLKKQMDIVSDEELRVNPREPEKEGGSVLSALFPQDVRAMQPWQRNKHYKGPGDRR